LRAIVALQRQHSEKLLNAAVDTVDPPFALVVSNQNVKLSLDEPDSSDDEVTHGGITLARSKNTISSPAPQSKFTINLKHVGAMLQKALKHRPTVTELIHKNIIKGLQAVLLIVAKLTLLTRFAMHHHIYRSADQ